MSLDDVFREANKRRAAIARAEGQHSGEQNANRTAELAERQKIAKLIDMWLRQTHTRIRATHYGALQRNGYDLQHQYELTPTVPGQTYSALTLFLRRGGVVHVLGAGRPGYKAEHRLEFTGDEKSGQITARFVSDIANTDEENKILRC